MMATIVLFLIPVVFSVDYQKEDLFYKNKAKGILVAFATLFHLAKRSLKYHNVKLISWKYYNVKLISWKYNVKLM